ncbi:MmgE/PrpD family protein [Paraburkholderia sp. BCC1886]|uniref:MmgE/PrpD family protein n=1 Tax=Paraburkholderia sp. BCC1886 TaxID=2562670 RepID=UPI00118245E6|nr:MmgE/PrpD family protein [Paraburkholderia sp. BCC1886]
MSNTDMTIAGKLARFVVQARAEPARFEAEVRAQASQRLLDNLGCIAFGTSVGPARTIADLAVSLGAGAARLVGTNVTTSPTAAAFAHGTLAQSFELNDLGVYVHPGACVLPACLAGLDLASQPVDGSTFAAAIIAGYEVTVRVSECVGPSPELDIGWHTPPFHGAIGAAASAAMLMGLDEAAIAQALVIAADLAGGGLMLARLGSDIKRVHCGRGAETGVLAALMARAGLKSRLDTFEHADWGYCRTMVARSDGFDLSAITSGLGDDVVAFRRTAVKYYPVGAEVLGVIDTVTALKREHAFTADDVERLHIGTPAFFVKAEAHEFPERDAQIHFNSEYGAAMALVRDVRPVYDDASILSYWADGYHDPAVRRLAARITHGVDAERDRQNPYGIDSTVRVELRDGRRFEGRTGYVDRAESNSTMQFNTMSEARIVSKFNALLGQLAPPETRSRIVDTALGIGALPDANVLWTALQAIAKSH